MNNELNSVGLLELSSIALGHVAEDAMLKAAAVEVLLARTICSGKFLVVIGGILWVLRTGAPWKDRKRAKTQDGHPLRRMRRRWRVERLFAWLQNYRRLVTRYERRAGNFLGFLYLGCICILLRYF